MIQDRFVWKLDSKCHKHRSNPQPHVQAPRLSLGFDPALLSVPGAFSPVTDGISSESNYAQINVDTVEHEHLDILLRFAPIDGVDVHLILFNLRLMTGTLDLSRSMTFGSQYQNANHPFPRKPRGTLPPG